MTSRLALLAVLLTFAGSLAGFHLTTAVGEHRPGGPGSLAGVRPGGETLVFTDGETRGDCPRVGRLWEEA